MSVLRRGYLTVSVARSPVFSRPAHATTVKTAKAIHALPSAVALWFKRGRA